MRIDKVVIVPGKALANYWGREMQKIFIENREGFYIDAVPVDGGTDWKLFEGQNVTNFYIKDSAGYEWLQTGNLVINAGENIVALSRQPGLIKADDGHFVRSRAELVIDNFLYQYKILHAYEKQVPILGNNIYCDFYIPHYDVYIEFWGMEEDPVYMLNKERKIALYRANDINLIELNNGDITNLGDIFPIKLLEQGIHISKK